MSSNLSAVANNMCGESAVYGIIPLGVIIIFNQNIPPTCM